MEWVHAHLRELQIALLIALVLCPFVVAVFVRWVTKDWSIVDHDLDPDRWNN